MCKHVCDLCGYVYDSSLGDPDNGIKPGTKFEEIPEQWLCPLCGVGKENFVKVEVQKIILIGLKNKSIKESNNGTIFRMYILPYR